MDPRQLLAVILLASALRDDRWETWVPLNWSLGGGGHYLSTPKQICPASRPRGDVLTEDSEEAEGHVISQGWLIDFLQRFPDPTFALPGRPLYRVFVNGSGFRDSVEDSEPLIGFYVTVFVRAGSPAEAERKARHQVETRWQSFHQEAEGPLHLLVEECEPTGDRFKLRSTHGFAFYSEDDEEAPI